MTYQFGGEEIGRAGVGMTNQMKSNELAGRENQGAEPLIELTESADSATDEDVIELTDVFSAPEGEEGGIIELTQVAAEEIPDPMGPLMSVEDDHDAPIEQAPAAPHHAAEDTLELAEGGPAAVVSPENQTEDPEPPQSLLADAEAFSALAATEARHESELLDFGDLDLDDADPQSVSTPAGAAPGEPEEALFLEDHEMLDFSNAAGGETQDAAGMGADIEGRAPAQAAAETHGLLDLEDFSTPPAETSLEGDEFSNIFDDLTAGAGVAAAPAGQPPAADRREVPEDTGRVQTAMAPEKHKSGEMGDGEEKFILGAGGIRMREKANDSAQAPPAAAQAVTPAAQAAPPADALMVSPAQVEAAVERVVRRMFSERIEAMLLEVLEKAVLKEIQRIKDTLLVGSSENDSR